MAKKAIWHEQISGYVVVIYGSKGGPGTGKGFVAFATDTGQPFHRRAFYPRRAEAMRAKREELSQFKTRIEKATLTIAAVSN